MNPALTVGAVVNTSLRKKKNLGAILYDFEAEVLRRALIHGGGNQCRTARNLGIHRNTLLRKLEEHSICPTAIRRNRHWLVKKKPVAKASLAPLSMPAINGRLTL